MRYMETPTYQVHAVLSSLSRRLSCQTCGEQDPGNKVAEDRRLQGVIERVSNRIIERITQEGVNQEKNGRQEHLQASGSGNQKPLRFQFSILDKNGRCQLRTIPIEAASLLLLASDSDKKPG